MSVKKIICEQCGQEISVSNYSKHLRRHKNHPETFKITYKPQHEGLNCQYCNKECKNINSLTQHELRCKDNPNRINCVMPNFNCISRVAWNKGLTKETDERVRNNGNSIRISYETGKIKKLTGDLNPSKREEVKQKISNTCLLKSSEGTWHKSLAKNMHYRYKGVDLDGTWELNYAKYLDANSIKWERCTDRFEYIWENKIHYYTPDFYLYELHQYVEIKGYQTDKDLAKWQQFPYNQTLVVLKEKELRDLGII